MPKSFHYDPWVGALADQHRGVGMAKVVESKILQPNLFSSGTEDTAIEVRVTTNPAEGVGEHVGLRLVLEGP